MTAPAFTCPVCGQSIPEREIHVVFGPVVLCGPCASSPMGHQTIAPGCVQQHPAREHHHATGSRAGAVLLVTLGGHQ